MQTRAAELTTAARRLIRHHRQTSTAPVPGITGRSARPLGKAITLLTDTYSAIWPISGGSTALVPLTRVVPAGGTGHGQQLFQRATRYAIAQCRDRACADVEPVPPGGGGYTAPTGDNWKPSRCRTPIAGHPVSAHLAAGFPSSWLGNLVSQRRWCDRPAQGCGTGPAQGNAHRRLPQAPGSARASPAR